VLLCFICNLSWVEEDFTYPVDNSTQKILPSFRTLTDEKERMRPNEVWICPDTEPPGLCPCLSMALVMSPFEEEEEGISIVSDLVQIVRWRVRIRPPQVL